MWGSNWGTMLWSVLADVPTMGPLGWLALAVLMVAGAALYGRLGARGKLALVLLGIAGLPMLAAAVDVPNTFVNGTVADANKVNQNFSVLASSIAIVGVTTRTNCTRQALPNAQSTVLESFTVDKKSATSKLLIQGTIVAHGASAGHLQQAWKYGAGVEVNAQSVMYDENALGKVIPTQAVVAGHATTGPQTLVFRYFSNNLDPLVRPFLVYNPSSLDDVRLAQTCSVYSVFEIEG